MLAGTRRISRPVAFAVLGQGQKSFRKTGVKEQKYINYSGTTQVDGW